MGELDLKLDPDEITIEDLDRERKRRGISKSTMSIISGFESQSSWGNALSDSHAHKNISEARKRQAIRALVYYDQHGYVPEPWEVEG